MTKHRTTAQQRAREMQRAPGARLTYGTALESARRVPGPDQARAALRDLAEAGEVSPSWRERIRHHLTVADGPGRPGLAHAAELRADLHLLAGVPASAHDLPPVPGAFEHFPLAALRRADRESREAFAAAAACALAGPLRHLLRHPYGQPPPLDDVVYRSRTAPISTSHRRLTVDTPDGLYVHELSYPRPWGSPDVAGFYRTDGARGRREMARAVLAHALGGAAPASLASCRPCQGTGWLKAPDGEHEQHAPAYLPDRGPVCVCAGCRGTGLRPLPESDFDNRFGSRIQGAGVARSEILGWATAGRLPAVPEAPALCGDGPQSGYAAGAIDAVRAAGFTVDGEEPYGLDFDALGGMGIHFAAGGEAALRVFGRERVLVFWFCDQGWSVAGFGAHRQLLPAEVVPAPQSLAAALLGCAAPDGDQSEEGVRSPQRDVDVYTAVMAYLPSAAG